MKKIIEIKSMRQRLRK